MSSTDSQAVFFGKTNCDLPMVACSILRLPEGHD